MKRYRLLLTPKQIDAVSVALSEYAEIEFSTESGAKLGRYYESIRDSMWKQVRKQSTPPAPTHKK